ncbi:MAG: hypothetical protein AABN34_21185 [Acidobacteriota bacterium]
MTDVIRRPTLFLPILAAALLSLGCANAFACTCALPSRNLSVKQQVNDARKRSKAVFSGQVLEITAAPDSNHIVVKLRVERTWKNIRGEEVLIVTGRGGGDCGYRFTVGATYLVYAYGTDDTSLGTNICQRTAKFREALADVKILGRGRPPLKAKM